MGKGKILVGKVEGFGYTREKSFSDLSIILHGDHI
jgi:hypothetical protein